MQLNRGNLHSFDRSRHSSPNQYEVGASIMTEKRLFQDDQTWGIFTFHHAPGQNVCNPFHMFIHFGLD